MIKRFLAGVSLTLALTTSAMADDVLIVGAYGDAGTNIKAELEAAGHTATEVSSLPADISNIDQIWDLRINSAISSADQTAYDTFLQDSGYLYLAGENSSFATRNNSISAFTSTLGGGAVSVGGRPNNAQDGNDSYFSNDTTVDFIAAATITNDGGTGRVLAADADGNPTAMIWIGNAGDFSDEYNGTVVVIADINWTQSNYYDANNEIFLEELIGGVVAGTVNGTIDDTGTGTDVGGTSEPTVTGTAPGTPIVTTTTAPGGTVTTIVTNNAVSETTTEQTVVETTTTTVTTATNTTTCTTPTTVSTWSDGSETTANGTETCSTATTYSSTESSVDQTFTGRIDQLASAQDINNSVVRGLEFDGLNGVAANHKYNNGLEGSTQGFTLGGKKQLDNGAIIGGGVARLSTSVNDVDNNSASASSTVLDANIGRTVENGTVTLGVRHAMTDYSMSRNIGPYANTGSTKGTDTSARVMFEGNGEKVKPVLGYTRGKRSTDAYNEGGDALTARSVAESSEMYGYATIGGTVDLGLLDVTALHHTDSVNDLSVGLKKESETVNWEVRVNRTMTDFGDTNSLSAGISWKF
jgi:hypothetical protein